MRSGVLIGYSIEQLNIGLMIGQRHKDGRVHVVEEEEQGVAIWWTASASVCTCIAT